MGTKGKLLIIALLMSGIVSLLVWSKNGDRKKSMPAAGANNGAIEGGAPVADDTNLRPIDDPDNGDRMHMPDPGTGSGGIRIEAADGGSRTPPVIDTTSQQDPPPVVRPPAAASKSYKVEPGDSLAKISLKVYGKEKYWQKIFEANKDKMSSPDDLLRVGTALNIPVIADAPAVVNDVAQAPPADPPVVRNDPPRNDAAKKTYKVKAGDTLSSIAKSQLGDANKWRAIFTANKDKLQNPDSLYEGMDLLIP
ncbi:MAG: LysM peptidoglycan-binding domain-containing protein [Planctomycetota bacterium]